MDRVVPWMHWAEWKQVREWLISDDRQQQQHGVQRVRIWEQRGNVPTSADFTANFIELLLQCDALEAQKTEAAPSMAITSRSLRLSAAMAMTRFVNGIVDPEQKSFFARSVQVVAGEVNLPVFMVDIRHDATHNELPPLPVLKVSMLKALEWLKNTYWKVQQEAGEGTGARVIDLLDKYCENRRVAITGKRKGAETADSMATRCLEMIKTTVGLKFLKSALVAALLKTGYLIPEKKEERASFENLNVPQALLAIWKPALEYWQREFADFATVMLEGIVEKVQQDELQEGTTSLDLLDMKGAGDSNQKSKPASPSKLFTLVAWARHFLIWNHEQNGSLLMIKPSDFLRTFLTKPTKYKILILMDAAKYSLDKKTKNSLTKGVRLARLMIKGTTKSKDSAVDFELIPQGEDEEGDIDEEDTTAASETSTSTGVTPKGAPGAPSDFLREGSGGSGPWKTCEPGEWSACHLGALPTNLYPSLDLPLHVPRAVPASAKRSADASGGDQKNHKKPKTDEPPPRADLGKLKGKIILF